MYPLSFFACQSFNMQIKISVSLILLVFIVTHHSFSQGRDTTNANYQIKGSVTITNKGISFIPSFSLGKPAAIFDLSMGRNKLFFEPQLRFSLEGKPWSFLFWWRYRIAPSRKVAITLGAHPAMNFRTDSFLVQGANRGFIVARRYLAGELAPNYSITKTSTVGLYYLYSRGLDRGTVRNTHFLTLNCNFSNIKLGNKFYARVTPQLYYLIQDAKDGYFLTSTFSFAKQKFPLSVQSIINKRLHSDIPGSEDFLWNASLIYSFNTKL